MMGRWGNNGYHIICQNTCYSSIVGGYSNSNSGSYNSSILGGGCNHVNIGDYSIIAGGCCNTNHALLSAILGGCGNTISAGYNNAHIVGSGIVLGSSVGNPNSLHVNNLWFDPATIISYAGFPATGYSSGTVYVDTSTNNTLRMNP
jgi:hypothetical protein